MLRRPTSLSLNSIRLLCLLFAGTANAGTITGGAGSDYQTGPQAQSYRSALLFGFGECAAGDLTLAGIRYGDSKIGPGTGLFANGSVTLGSRLRTRAVLLRAIGDDTYRAWRWRLGPELKLAGDRTLGAYYLRLTNNADEALSSVGMELSTPITPSLTGQIGSSYGWWTGDATTTQASLSATWRPMPRVLLLGELDVGRNLATTSSAGPAGGGGLGGLPLPGGLGQGQSGAPTTETTSDVSEAALVGIRFLIR